MNFIILVNVKKERQEKHILYSMRFHIVNEKRLPDEKKIHTAYTELRSRVVTEMLCSMESWTGTVDAALET